MNAAATLTKDPRRLAALCTLWQEGEQEVWITLKGESMMPTLPPGSRLRLRCNLNEMEVGNIIAYRRDNALIVHRLQAVVVSPENEERLFVCKGDGNRKLDPPVTADMLVGTIVASSQPKIRSRIQYKLSRAFRPYRSAAQSLARYCRCMWLRRKEPGLS